MLKKMTGSIKDWNFMIYPHVLIGLSAGKSDG